MTKEEVLALLIRDMEKFLCKHSNLRFYALAFDCNAEYANFLVCMNTTDEFEKTLQWYQKRYENYNQEENILELRYNPGDWEYTDISQVDLFSEEELAEYKTLIANDGLLRSAAGIRLAPYGAVMLIREP